MEIAMEAMGKVQKTKIAERQSRINEDTKTVDEEVVKDIDNVE